MKKALALVILIVIPSIVFAQGTVVIGNQTGLVKEWVTSSDSTLISVPKGSGFVELIAAPKGTSLTPLFTGGLNYTTLAAFLAANPGWAVPTGTANPGPTGLGAGVFANGNATISGIAAGGSADYIILGWTGPSTTVDAAIAGWIAGTAMFGESAIATTQTGDPTATPPGLPVSLKTTFPGLTLTPCLSCPYFQGFTAQPTDQTVHVGATATFYVGAIAYPPPYYQWYFNGVSIPWSNGSSFQISNAQLTNAGTYWVVLSDPFYPGWGVHTSQSATLTVLAPPVITTPPRSQTAYVDSTVNFHASAAGSEPLACQWFFNGSAISGAGSTYLQLTNLQSSQSGTYMVVVTNIAGVVTSPPAMLSVIPPVERRMVPGLSLLGQPGSHLNLEGADTVERSPAWVTLDSVIFTNALQWYFDVSEPLPSQRFYRAWQTSGPSVIPTLSLYMVPAITLTGTIGHSVRLDYINQFGPIDAWFTLATVTLTNTSQLYFDISAPGQPPRLYRLVPSP